MVRCKAAPKPLPSGAGLAPVRGKHFLHLDDFSKEQLVDMLDQGMLAKKKFYARDETFKPFAGGWETARAASMHQSKSLLAPAWRPPCNHCPLAKQSQ